LRMQCLKLTAGHGGRHHAEDGLARASTHSQSFVGFRLARLVYFSSVSRGRGRAPAASAAQSVWREVRRDRPPTATRWLDGGVVGKRGAGACCTSPAWGGAGRRWSKYTLVRVCLLAHWTAPSSLSDHRTRGPRLRVRYYGVIRPTVRTYRRLTVKVGVHFGTTTTTPTTALSPPPPATARSALPADWRTRTQPV
jgi:hypothetical protein